MRIVFDIQGLQNLSRDRGIGRYVLSLARALAAQSPKHELFFLISDLFPDTADQILERLGDGVDRHHIVRFHGCGPCNEFDSTLEENRYISEALYSDLIQRISPDALIVGSVIEGVRDNTITVTHSRLDPYVSASVLYDLIPLLDMETYLGDEVIRNWYFRRLNQLCSSDLLFAISESARQEGIEHVGLDVSRIVNIGAAASKEFTEAVAETKVEASARVLQEFGISRPFIMHASAFDARKNFRGLVEAFAKLPSYVRRSYQLVLVCHIDDHGRGIIAKWANDLRLSNDDVIVTGFVTDEQLRHLYHSAVLFAFPSLHEGFGLPPLEAMCCGTPTIGSNVSSIPEVIGRSDALFDPTSPSDISRLIEKALTDSDFLCSLREHALEQASRFSWEHTAQNAIEALEKAVAIRKRAAGEWNRHFITFGERLRGIAACYELGSDLLRRISIAFSRNCSEAVRVGAVASANDKLTWRIEGPFDSSYSLALLNRETSRALNFLGHRVVLHSTEGPGDFPADPAFLASNPDIAMFHDRVTTFAPAQCDVVSRNLYPPRVADLTGKNNALHHYAWEESGFPADWVRSFNQHLDFITCLSTHVEKILIDNGVSVPMSVSGCGVDHWVRVVPTAGFDAPGKAFRFLHVSSCFPRKGADLLLKAYGKAFSSDDDVTLIIKTFANPHNQIYDMVSRARQENPRFPDIVIIMDDLSEGDLKALYGACDVMVCPTKAEGYGLPMAEAMLSGIPVITTAWGGQTDFCNESNAWLVDYQFERADTHFCLWSSAWARVDITSLVDNLRAAFESTADQRSKMAEVGSAQLLAHHKWIDTAARLVNAAKNSSVRGNLPAPARIGWVSTWNTKCGIATYSEHLVSNMPRPITVFANRDLERISSDGANVVRCWNVSKKHGGLTSILGAVRSASIDVVIIQFNYGFFNHEELADLIKNLKTLRISVLLTLHSTVDPVQAIPGNELWRIVEALKSCDRLLVHSVSDLNRLKAIGLVENVTLFPHGVLIPEAHPEPVDRPDNVPLVATYGFALPHKGLKEAIQAVAFLRDNGRRVRLRMVNAEYPNKQSRAFVKEIRDEIGRLKLSNLIELHSDFLPDDRSLELLSDADLIVFPYRETGESASGAVRYGMSTGKPVGVTPLEIFDDVSGATFLLDGTSVPDIAKGIDDILTRIANDAPEIRAVKAAADRWREQHDYRWLGERLLGMADALAAKTNLT